ncbi:hypothetical protein J3Q64DRAFT_1817972 [Phycomyces blakesleeanus]|uniref:C2H2-type domain-containing protein n=2 Tax=Phycomyces blakesleeanus TaxID=4837 RepID=A0ABR3BIP7_PHYBL
MNNNKVLPLSQGVPELRRKEKAGGSSWPDKAKGVLKPQSTEKNTDGSKDEDRQVPDNGQDCPRSPVHLHDFSLYRHPFSSNPCQSDFDAAHQLLTAELKKEDEDPCAGEYWLDIHLRQYSFPSDVHSNTPVNHEMQESSVQSQDLCSKENTHISLLSESSKSHTISPIPFEIFRSLQEFKKALFDFLHFELFTQERRKELVEHYKNICKPKNKNSSVICPNPNCFKRLGRWYQLDVHLKSHFGIGHFSCSYEDCKKIFASQEIMKRHLKSVHEKKLYQCDGCYKSYNRKDELTRHSKRHNNL